MSEPALPCIVRSKIMNTEVQKDQVDDATFESLGLIQPVLDALKSAGYEKPTPIQASAIPHLVSGHDIIGQAKTGTGKTAAFTLPLLGRIDLTIHKPQILVIAPTRELALQVSESVTLYGQYIKGLRVLPVYGGQGMGTQLKSLKRGVHIVVGTPGRLIDHLKRGTLVLDQVNALVLDEADEMLRMGFIEDVETIMESMPKERLTALFSATMPPPIARIAQRFLDQPVNIHIKGKETTVEAISQEYVPVSGARKLEALSRILEVETYEGVIVFARTKVATMEIVEGLLNRGIEAVALNGDMNQQARQHTVDRFKDARVDILVCTDVAARGLDVPRVSHVINYDIPYDSESYVHRIGRTGRAGREGKAITFVARNELRMFKIIEKATRKAMVKFNLPTAEQISQKRIDDFKKRVLDVIKEESLGQYLMIVDELSRDGTIDPNTLSAALIALSQTNRPFIVPDRRIEDEDRTQRSSRRRERSKMERGPKQGTKQLEYQISGDPKKRPMSVYKVMVGSALGLEPRNLVGAIANETGIPSKAIGSIRIAREYSLVELPANMPSDLLDVMKKIWVCGVQLQIRPERNQSNLNDTHRRKFSKSFSKGSKRNQSFPKGSKKRKRPGIKR